MANVNPYQPPEAATDSYERSVLIRGKIACPACSRTLRVAPEDQTIVCDGCDERFTLESLRYEPRGIGAKIVGTLLIALGGLLLIQAFLRVLISLWLGPALDIGMMTLPVVLLAVGAWLLRGKIVREGGAQPPGDP